MQINGNAQFILNNLNKLNNYSSKILFRPGQIIYYKDHKPYGLYILEEGTIEIDYKKYRENIKPITPLALNSFSQSTPYKGTAKAITVCLVSFLSKNKYIDLLNNGL